MSSDTRGGPATNGASPKPYGRHHTSSAHGTPRVQPDRGGHDGVPDLGEFADRGIEALPDERYAEAYAFARSISASALKRPASHILHRTLLRAGFWMLWYRDLHRDGDR